MTVTVILTNCKMGNKVDMPARDSGMFAIQSNEGTIRSKSWSFELCRDNIDWIKCFKQLQEDIGDEQGILRIAVGDKVHCAHVKSFAQWTAEKWKGFLQQFHLEDTECIGKNVDVLYIFSKKTEEPLPDEMIAVETQPDLDLFAKDIADELKRLKRKMFVIQSNDTNIRTTLWTCRIGSDTVDWLSMFKMLQHEIGEKTGVLRVSVGEEITCIHIHRFHEWNFMKWKDFVDGLGLDDGNNFGKVVQLLYIFPIQKREDDYPPSSQLTINKRIHDVFEESPEEIRKFYESLYEQTLAEQAVDYSQELAEELQELP